MIPFVAFQTSLKTNEDNTRAAYLSVAEGLLAWLLGQEVRSP